MQKSTTMYFIGGVAVLGVIALGAIKLSTSPTAESTPVPTSNIVAQNSPVPTPNNGMPSPKPTNESAKVFEIEAGSFYYKPNEIKVKKGDTIKIIMTSKDMMHDFNIDELNVKIPVTRSGNTAEVTFVANEAGKFEFYCSVGAHKAQGQVGTLIVE